MHRNDRRQACFDDLFWQKVDIRGPDECWPWKLATSVDGYGITQRPGTHALTRAHRRAYEEARGPIPDGLCGLHRCDNPPCCNPAHTTLGTKADNSVEMVVRGRSLAGRHPLSKLTDETVRLAREWEAAGIARAKIAQHLGVSQSTISKACRRQKWSHVA